MRPRRHMLPTHLSKLVIEDLDGSRLQMADPPRVERKTPARSTNVQRNPASRNSAMGQMTPAGLEPAIPGSVGRCLIHWATGPPLYRTEFAKCRWFERAVARPSK